MSNCKCISIDMKDAFEERNIKINVDDLILAQTNIKLQEKTIDSSTTVQVVLPDENYDALEKVTVNPYVLQHKNASPSINEQVILPDEEYNGLNGVTISTVTSSIDNNIQPENIVNGVTILGVTGTYKRQDLVGDYYNAFNFTGTGMVRQTAITGYTNTSCVPGKTDCNYCFQYCYSLEYVNVPRLQTMGTCWFTKCYALTSVDFSAMTRIGVACFEECTALVSVRLPSCTQLLSKAFQKCSALTDVYLGYNGVCTANAADVFVDVPNKVKIHVPNGLKASYEVATNWADFIANNKCEIIEDYV